MNRNQLQNLTKLRVKEAKILRENGYFTGAYYLLGYAVECALKACIAKQVREHDFPNKKLANDSYTHNLITLLKIANLTEEMKSSNNGSNDRQENWSIITGADAWSEAIRYNADGITQPVMNDFWNAVTDENKGILKWLETYW